MIQLRLEEKKMKMSELYSLVETMSDTQMVDTLVDYCNKFCLLCGFELFSFVVFSAASLASPKIFKIANFPTDTTDTEEISSHSTIVRYCFENTVPIRWSKLAQTDKAGTLMHLTDKYGICEGLSVPLRSPNGSVASFSLSTYTQEDIEKRLFRALPFAQYFSHSLLESYQGLAFDPAFENIITAQEKESLFWACEGKTAWEMSQIMSTSERSINYHLASATKKLGACNRQHAVAKAILFGLIKPSI